MTSEDMTPHEALRIVERAIKGQPGSQARKGLTEARIDEAIERLWKLALEGR